MQGRANNKAQMFQLLVMILHGGLPTRLSFHWGVGGPMFLWLVIFVSFVTRYAIVRERENEHHKVKISRDLPAQEILDTIKRENWSKITNKGDHVTLPN
jgi:hypothetical protein